MDPALLAKPEWSALTDFLRHPFSEKSCAQVTVQLPQLAQAYCAMAQTRTAWAGALPVSHANNATSVFDEITAVGAQSLPKVSEDLLKAQVILLDEVLRDNAAWVRKRAMKENPDSAYEPLPTLDAETSRTALHAIALHEATFLALAGLFEVQCYGRQIVFSFTARGLECLRNRVITAPMQRDTENALRLHLNSIIAELRRYDRTSTSGIAALLVPTILDDLEDRLLDVFFAMGFHMRRDKEIAPLIGDARKLCRWFALLELVRQAGEITLRPQPELFERLRLDTALLEHVLAKRIGDLPSNQGIYRSSSGALSLGTGGLSHAINCCKGSVVSDNQASKLGEYFEEHIKAYIQERVPSRDYVVRDGFKRSENGEGKMYDCDLILYDVRRRKIFFVQAKWKLVSHTASLEDELLDWRGTNWPLTKGVKQLAVLRARLPEKTVLDKVKAALRDIKLSDEHILTNSHFIVVHTLPYFSAYEIDGVVVYEWNLLRNLLLRGVIRRSWSPDGTAEHAVPLPIHVHDATFALEDPQKVLDYYCEAAGADLAQMPVVMQVRQYAKYGFDLTLPRASWWQRITKRHKFAIARPYI